MLLKWKNKYASTNKLSQNIGEHVSSFISFKTCALPTRNTSTAPSIDAILDSFYYILKLSIIKTFKILSITSIIPYKSPSQPVTNSFATNHPKLLLRTYWIPVSRPSRFPSPQLSKNLSENLSIFNHKS